MLLIDLHPSFVYEQQLEGYPKSCMFNSELQLKGQGKFKAETYRQAPNRPMNLSKLIKYTYTT